MQAQDGQPAAELLERAVGAEREQVAAPAMPPAEASHAPETIKVSTRSRPSAVAGAIAGIMRQRGMVDVQSIGAGATNQAIKAVAIACVYLREDGIAACCVPSFMDVLIDGEERTAVRLVIQHRPTAGGDG